MSEEKKDNLIKEVCKELEITQKELSEQLDVPQSTVSGWANGDIPKMTEKALKLIIENKNLKQKLNIFKEAFKISSEL